MNLKQNPLKQTNNDLYWDLSMFKRRQTAIEFIESFKSRLPVYSPFVKQLYTSYTVHFPSDVERGMVILPNQWSYHDTFNSITENAVVSTGLSIFPKTVNGQSIVCLRIPFNKVGGEQRYRDIPLHYGINIITRSRPDQSPFLPIISKGDLRNLDVNTPCLHLHNLELTQLQNQSGLELSLLKKTISQNIKIMASDLFKQ